MKKDFQPEQKPNNEPLPIDSTSSPNCTKPNVICSQNDKPILFSCQTVQEKNEYKNTLTVKAKELKIKYWLNFVMDCLKNVDGFYEWFTNEYKNNKKQHSICFKIECWFYFDMAQIRELYLLMSSKPILTQSPSKSKTTVT
jgi:hypothetical protein